MTRQERIFLTISASLSAQPLIADVLAALFRALPLIEGVVVQQDADRRGGAARRRVRLHGCA
ncbi:hypothetical protein ACBI99_27150 [Nonomuraea sp. ATR24]|uniref:hypothetical protein n=1 Tax=Nonomuraea sp. ATR24 TaxID=1676744 RepID=UPI0035C22528